MTRDLTVAFGGTHPAKIERTVTIPWDRYVDLFIKTPEESTDKAAAGWSIPARFDPAYRDGKNLIDPIPPPGLMDGCDPGFDFFDERVLQGNWRKQARR